MFPMNFGNNNYYETYMWVLDDCKKINNYYETYMRVLDDCKKTNIYYETYMRVLRWL
jgi:hypothetical protein